MAIVIEKGVPLAKSVRKARESKYPFAQMEGGDSFFIPGNKAAGKIRSSVSIATKAGHGKFSVRTVEEGGKIGVRVYKLDNSVGAI